jgi:hypothetical protein
MSDPQKVTESPGVWALSLLERGFHGKPEFEIKRNLDSLHLLIF